MLMVRAHSFKSIPFIHLYTEFKLTKSETHTNSIELDIFYVYYIFLFELTNKHLTRLKMCQ